MGDCEERTPLHRAVKYGDEKIVEFLLESGANQNHQSTRSGKTPLHRATTPKIVRILLNYGADPFIRSFTDKETNKKGQSAYDSLFIENDELPRVVLDSFLRTNKKENESSDLLFVYDLNFFRNTRYEMAQHACMVEYDSKLLFHPLTEAMTRLKWRIQSKMRYLFVMMKLLFAASLTLLVTSKFATNPSDTNATSIHSSNNDSKSNATENYCKLTENKKETIAYILVFVSVLLLLIDELKQMLANILSYFTNWKNWMDLTMIISAIVFLSVDFDCFINVQHGDLPSPQLAAISIFFAWFNLVLLLGGIPSVGIYIYMFTNVSKTLLFFIMIYSPALIAFALCFYVLVPDDVKAFKNPGRSILKIMAMMIGELEYEQTFLGNNEANQGTSARIILAWIMSVGFVCFATIVIMNLLVGLTVSEMEKLKSEARQVSLKQHVSQLINFQQFWYKDCDENNGKRSPKGQKSGELSQTYDQSRCHRIFWKILGHIFNQNSTVFSALENAMNRNEETMLTKRSCKRVCVKANVKKAIAGEKKNKFWSNISDLLPGFLQDSSYKVYFYDERRMEHGSDTGFRFPKELVENTKESLKSKKALKDEIKKKNEEGFEEEFKKYLKLKEIETQFKTD